jgi:hypothetical protein
MSLIEINGVTALIGVYLTDQSDVQISRRISKVVLHEEYNAFNSVSRYKTHKKKTKSIFDI